MTAHTYTVHLLITATDDDEAARIAASIRDAASAGTSVHGIALTDADDWAEHLALDNPSACRSCGAPANRARIGNGQRTCPACAGFQAGTYPVIDVDV